MACPQFPFAYGCTESNPVQGRSRDDADRSEMYVATFASHGCGQDEPSIGSSTGRRLGVILSASTSGPGPYLVVVTTKTRRLRTSPNYSPASPSIISTAVPTNSDYCSTTPRPRRRCRLFLRRLGTFFRTPYDPFHCVLRDVRKRTRCWDELVFHAVCPLWLTLRRR